MILFFLQSISRNGEAREENIPPTGVYSFTRGRIKNLGVWGGRRYARSARHFARHGGRVS